VLAKQTQCAAASQRQAAQPNAVGVHPWLFAGASEAIFLPKRLNPDLSGFEDFQDDYPVNPIIGGIGVQTIFAHIYPRKNKSYNKVAPFKRNIEKPLATSQISNSTP
jgi:hypothetical protein